MNYIHEDKTNGFIIVFTFEDGTPLESLGFHAMGNNTWKFYTSNDDVFDYVIERVESLYLLEDVGFQLLKFVGMILEAKEKEKSKDIEVESSFKSDSFVDKLDVVNDAEPIRTSAALKHRRRRR